MGAKRSLFVLTALAVALAACGRADEAVVGSASGRTPNASLANDGPSNDGPSGDRLFLETAAGLTVKSADTGAVAFTAPAAVPTPDWSTLFRAEPFGDLTRLAAIDPLSGLETGSREVDVPGLAVRTVSNDGELVALGPPRSGDGAYPAGREEKTLVVTGLTGDLRRFDLAGNFEPDAFSIDGTGLFLIEYTPPASPDRYGVRRLDLGSGTVGEVTSRDKEVVQEEMRGTARTQVLSPDGTRLYTLYTVETLGTAFVHVLSLDEQWAHCVDLPPPFGEAPDTVTALAVSPDGDRLFVADASAGALAEVDTRELAVARAADLPMDPESDAAGAAVGEGVLYVGSGSEVTTVDTGSLEAVGGWPIDGTLSSVRLGPDGDRLYVALRDHVAVFETGSGHQVRLFAAQGVRSISLLEGDAAPQPPVAPPSDYQCAC
jgi:hypothetical protein